MLKLYIKISYTVDKNHPDRGGMSDTQWEAVKDMVHTYYDIYTFTTLDACKEHRQYALEYAKSDMKLVAGGGYNSKHIHNVKFNYKFM